LYMSWTFVANLLSTIESPFWRLHMKLYDSYPKRFGRRQERKNSRIFFNIDQSVIAECKTEQSIFKGSVKNLSAEGIFIETNIPISIGEEIAFSFILPSSKQTIRATGIVVRSAFSGIGVNIKIIFRE
jgi:hypothetical protein